MYIVLYELVTGMVENWAGLLKGLYLNSLIFIIQLDSAGMKCLLIRSTKCIDSSNVDGFRHI